MQQPYPHTAIVIFARSVHVEARKKILTYKDRKTNQALIRQFNQQTEQIALSTGLAVLCVNGNTNHSESFGCKLESAFQKVFDSGYQNVITIGNDCPHLTADALLCAAEQLNQKGIVIGPSSDGGIYLLGIRKDTIGQVSFQELPWRTRHLYDALLEQINSTTCELLPTENDIDNPADLMDFLKSPGKSTLQQRIKCLLQKHSPLGAVEEQILIKLSFYLNHFRRGPPLMAS